MIDPIEIPDSFELATTSASYNGVRVSTRVMPAAQAARGSDWCEAFAVSNDIIALSIGDICGHGVEQHDTMTATRQVIRDAAWQGSNPAQTLADANRFLIESHPYVCATAIFALLNTRHRSLVFANAGHPPPLVAGPCGARYLEFSDTDLMLGVEPEIRPAMRAVSMAAATLLVLYTDGVSEHDRKPLDGAAELCAATVFAYKFSKLLAASVIEQQMSLGGSNRDDAAILTAWMPGWPMANVLHPPESMIGLSV